MKLSYILKDKDEPSIDMLTINKIVYDNLSSFFFRDPAVWQTGISIRQQFSKKIKNIKKVY